MSEEESDSSSPDRDVKSETLSNPNSRSMDNNEDQTENNSNPRETPNIPDKNKDNFRNENEMLNQNGLWENDDKYIAMIEGLEDELYIEKYITKSLKKDANFNEEVNKLKLDLINKNNKLEQLKSINKKQETTLNEFRNKLKKENNKKSMNNKVIEEMKLTDVIPRGLSEKTNLSNKEIEEMKKKVEKAFKELKLTTNFEEACKNADLVIESIAENLEQKKEMYETLAKYLDKKAILVTNSSTLLPSKLASYSDRPEKFLGFHFANEIHKFNLVEIMPHPGTDKKYFDIMEDFAKKINMVPIKIFKEKANYIINSLLRPYIQNALELWVDGVAEPKIIDLTFKTALNAPFGPFESLDIIGISSMYYIRSMDPQINVEGTYNCKIFKKIKEMYDAGKLGRSTGEGFYKYK